MRNLATIEKVMRIVLGIAMISLVFIGPKTAWGWAGLILLATGSMSFCPIYRLLGISTYKPERVGKGK